MPGNDNPEIMHNFFEQDNSSEGHQSEAGGGGWPILNNNPWVGIQRQNGPQLTFSATNYTSQSTDSEHGNDMQHVQVPFGSNPSKKSELIRGQPINQHVNLNGCMHSSQGLQAEFQAGHTVSGHNLIQRGFSNFESQRTSIPVYDSALTRSSERPEATEAPVNFDFLGGQQLMRSQHPGISQPRPIQPQRINDMPLWQQQLIYKQLQEKHRQQQFLQLQQGITQQNLLSQLSNVSRQASGNPMPSILSGMPVSNAPNNMWSNEAVGCDQRLPSSSPMFLSGNMSWVQGSSMQGIPNGFMFSRDQGQAEGTMGFSPQQYDQSFYGTPVASTRGSLIHQSQFQGNFHQMNHVSPSLQIQGISGTLHEKAVEQVGPSCGISNLDPTEEKLLFSTDDDGNQGNSFGLNCDRSTGGYQENLMQTNDYFSSLPTLNSGSWSALMQEAVEASSSDTGLNEEWSGLSFHKTKLSSVNPSAVMHASDSKQQASWDEENLQNASSLTSRPLPLFNDAASSSNNNATANFLLPMNISCQQNEGAVASHEFFQQSSKEASNKPFDQSHQQKQPVGGSVQIQTQTQFNNICSDVWAGQTSEQPANSAHSLEVELDSHNTQDSWAHQKVPLHSHLSNKLNGWNTQSLAPSGDKASNCYANNDKRQHVQANNVNRTVNMQTDQNGSVWKVTGSQVARSTPSSAGGSEAVGANADALMMHNENSCLGNLAAVMNSSNLNLNQGTNQQDVNRQQGDYGKHVAVNAFCQNKREEFATKHQNQLSGNPQTLDSSMYNTIQRSGESCVHKQENRHPDNVLSEGFIPSNSQPAQNTEGGGTAVESSLLARNETQSLVNSGLKSLGQSARRNIGPRRFQYHPMGNLEMNTEPMDSQNHTLYSQHPSSGLKNQEQGYVVHAPFSGPSLNNDLDTGKGHLSDLQRNTKSAAEEINYRGSLSGHSAAPAINGSTSEFSQNIRTGLTSQNMLELLHKVDQSRATKPLEHVSFGQNTPSGRREVETSDGSSSHLQLSLSPSFQGFSLNLAPPSQRQSVSDKASPLQTSLQTANGFSQRNLDAGLSEDHSRPPSSSSGESLPRHETSQKESQGSISFLSGHQSKRAMHSNFQGNSLTAAVYTQKRQQSHDGASSNQSSVASMPPPSRVNSSSDTYPVNTGQSHAMVASSHLRSSGQHKPVVETRSLAHPSATSAMPRQGGISTRLHNVWTSISSQQRLSGVPPQKIISNVLQSKNPFSSDRESLKAPQKLDNHNKRKGESSPSEFGTSTNSQQFTYAEDCPAKDNFSQQMPPSDSVDVDTKKGNASLGPVREPELKYHSDGNPNVSLSSAASSSCDTEAYGHPLGLPDAQKQNNYSLVQQMQAMKGADSDPTQRPGKRLKGPDFNMDTSQVGRAVGQRYIYGQNTVLRETDATSQGTSFPSDVKMLSFSSRDGKENSANKSLQVVGREVPSQNLLTHQQHNLQNHSQPQGMTSVVSFAGCSERSQVSPQMAPSWFEKYGNFNNGQPLTIYDGVSSFEKNAKASVQNYVIPKVSEGMVPRVVPEEKDDANLLGSFQQSTPSTALLPNYTVSSPGHSQLEVIDNNMILIPKKRKSATLDLLPWHKEVTQGVRRLQSISIMEQKWAWATNRLIDKLEEEFEMIEDGLSMTRSRRRLILTTQLMQQILPAVPSRFLSADAATFYESVIYVMAKLILGDACSLTSSGSDSCAVLDSDNMTLGKHNISAREGFTRFLRIVEEVIGRSKKMENDFLRLDSRVSILDVRLECQDLERNSIMNRFAKFHGRAQSDGIESSSQSETAPRQAYPQRHVTAHAMPRNLPEDVICLSL